MIQIQEINVIMRQIHPVIYGELLVTKTWAKPMKTIIDIGIASKDFEQVQPRVECGE